MIAPVDTHLLLGSSDPNRFPLAQGADAAAVRAAPDAKAVSRLLAQDRLAGAVLVLRGRDFGFDNAVLLEAVAGSDRLRALASVDGRREDAGHLARDLLARPGVAGLRLMEPERDAGLDWLSGPGALDAWRAAAERNAVMDVHAFPWNRAAVLGVTEKLLTEFREVHLLLDNCSNIALDQGPPDYGIDQALARLAERDGVTVKISAMSFARLSSAGHDPAGAVETLAARLGASRLCWGSDVLLPLGTTLEQAIGTAQEAVAGLSASDAKAVLAGNAQRIFGLSQTAAG